jgi:predicted peptidase
MDAQWVDDATIAGDGGLPNGPSSTRHRARPLSTTDAPSGFYEYLPPGYGDGVARPLLVFWHGVGENGDGEGELSRVLAHGPPRIIDGDQWPSSRPFVVLSPQHPGEACPGADELEAFFAWALARYHVDPRRVYLTGLSCGAIGGWRYLARYLDDRIAAFVPIAGDGRPAWTEAGCDLGRVPIWAFHGDADTTVDPAGSIEPLTHLLDECPSPPRWEMHLTVYPGVGHDSWSQTYDLSAGHDIYTWLLGFTR